LNDNQGSALAPDTIQILNCAKRGNSDLCVMQESTECRKMHRLHLHT